MDELWDVYDENRILTGDTVKRSSHPRNKDEYHLVVHIWIKNKSGEWLISKRAPNKFYPLLWECTGGSALAGESSLDAALRRLRKNWVLIFQEAAVVFSKALSELFIRIFVMFMYLIMIVVLTI